MQAPEQTYIDYQLPAGVSHLTPKELAAACGFSARHILDCYDEGKLMGYQSNGRGRIGREERFATRIPREWAKLFLIRRANFDDALIVQNLSEIIARLPAPLALRIQAIAADRVRRAAGRR